MIEPFKLQLTVTDPYENCACVQEEEHEKLFVLVYPDPEDYESLVQGDIFGAIEWVQRFGDRGIYHWGFSECARRWFDHLQEHELDPTKDNIETIWNDFVSHETGSEGPVAT